MIEMLLLAALVTSPKCEAKTNIPAFEESIKTACDNAEAGYKKSISLMGDINEVILIMTYTFDMTGMHPAGKRGILARQAALISHDWFYERFPMKKFTLIYRDTKDHEMCRFSFVGEALTQAFCVLTVGDGR